MNFAFAGASGDGRGGGRGGGGEDAQWEGERRTVQGRQIGFAFEEVYRATNRLYRATNRLFSDVFENKIFFFYNIFVVLVY